MQLDENREPRQELDLTEQRTLGMQQRCTYLTDDDFSKLHYPTN